MRIRVLKRWSICMSLALAGGCLHPVRQQVDAVICDMAAQPLDMHTPTAADKSPAQDSTSMNGRAGTPVFRGAMPGNEDTAVCQVTAVEAVTADPSPAGGNSQAQKPNQQPDAGRPGTPSKPSFEERLRLPPGLPGSREEIKRLPPNLTEAERKAYYTRYYPRLPPLPPLPRPQPGPYGHPLTLPELQQLAMSNNPSLRQAAAAVQEAEGAAKQAGAYPNPSFGYEADNVGTGTTAGYQGIFIEQIIKTGGKLKTAQASAVMSLLNANLALRRAQTDLITQVRTNYFAVLVAERNLRLNEALAEFNERLYTLFVEQVIGGQLAAYEPMQLRAFTNQARALHQAARNRYLSAWRQLTAALGLEDRLPLTELAGSAEMPVPVFNHEEALDRVLRRHTDIETARNTLQKARYDLHSAQIAPYPDIDVRVAVQKDFTAPPFNVVHNISVGMAIPILDQNRGAIRQAQGALLRAAEEEHRARTSLITSVADAYERYASNRQQVEFYRNQVLPDLGLVYRQALLRFGAQPQAVRPGEEPTSVASLDIITHLQIYSTAIASYSSVLAAQWTAVADLANFLQIDDLYLGVQSPPYHSEERASGLPLPCSHPCSPLPLLDDKRAINAAIDHDPTKPP